MAENGLDARTLLTVVGIFVMFFGLPVATIALDLRKQHRKQPDAPVEDATRSGSVRTITDGSRRNRVPIGINTTQRNEHAAVPTDRSHPRPHRNLS